MPNRRTLGLLSAFAAIYFIWGSTYLAIKFVVGFMPPLLMAGVRATTAGAFLLLWAWFRREPRPHGWAVRNGLLAGALMFFIGHGALFWASQYVPSGMAAVLVSTIPMWIAVFEALGRHNRGPGMLTGAGLVLGFGGVIWLNLPGTGAGIEPLWSAVILSGAASWALATVWYRGPRRSASAVVSAGLPLLGGGLLLLATSAALGEPARVTTGALSPEVLLALAYLIVFGSLVAFSAFIWLLERVSATSVASYAYVNPVVALLLGSMVGGEAFHGAMLLPVSAILLAVVMIVTGESLRPRTLQVEAS